MKIAEKIINHPFKYGLIAFAILISIFLLNFRKFDFPEEIEKWGQFGDYFGGILNPVFGLISVVLIAATLKSQTQSAKIQGFESQFFTLLSLYTSIVQGVDRKMQDKTIMHGRDCFKYFHKKIKSISQSQSITLTAAYQKFLETDGWELEHYFRTVYHIFKYVKEAGEEIGLNDEGKKRYYDLIKSQISQYELALLWLNIESINKGNWDYVLSDKSSDLFEHLNKTNVT